MRQAPAPDDPLQAPSPKVEDNIVRFYQGNLGRRIDALALSGGGQNGAYSVGLIKGWREVGIPRFGIVTGVSTGALIASHVFLDSADADQVLERFYTGVRKQDVMCMRNVITGLTSDAFASMVPLERLLERVIPNDVIDQVAAASEGGRRLLLVGTVNLDTGGYHIWDLGAMARERQYATYRAVLRASAGPPVAVPPVYLEGGMHCDGATALTVFLPFRKDALSEAKRAQLEAVERNQGDRVVHPGTVYVVVNGMREPAVEKVQPQVIPIARRALDVMTYSTRLGNLWYLQEHVEEAGGEFRLRFLPESLREDAKDFLAFDPKRMRRIFDQGVRDGRDPSGWEPEPPTLRPDP